MLLFVFRYHSFYPVVSHIRPCSGSRARLAMQLYVKTRAHSDADMKEFRDSVKLQRLRVKKYEAQAEQLEKHLRVIESDRPRTSDNRSRWYMERNRAHVDHLKGKLSVNMGLIKRCVKLVEEMKSLRDSKQPT
uniref:Uncharacterized protein n=1 Tax=Lotharella globosa TaxID=91324 RepID=A0A7S3YYH4_9EUKA